MPVRLLALLATGLDHGVVVVDAHVPGPGEAAAGLGERSEKANSLAAGESVQRLIIWLKTRSYSSLLRPPRPARRMRSRLAPMASSMAERSRSISALEKKFW
ncbi:MAG: hypothetical protein OXH85_05140 [Truepera sp.]|nr:hypothetical protein [Truepera sp.]